MYAVSAAVRQPTAKSEAATSAGPVVGRLVADWLPLLCGVDPFGLLEGDCSVVDLLELPAPLELDLSFDASLLPLSEELLPVDEPSVDLSDERDVVVATAPL